MSPDVAAHPMTAANWFLLGTIAGFLVALMLASLAIATADDRAPRPLRHPGEIEVGFSAIGVDRRRFFADIDAVKSEGYVTDIQLLWAECGAGVQAYGAFRHPTVAAGLRASRRRVANAAIAAWLAAAAAK